MKLLLRKKSILLTVISIMLVALTLSGCGGSDTGEDTVGDQPKIAFYAFNSEPILDLNPVEYSNGRKFNNI